MQFLSALAQMPLMHRVLVNMGCVVQLSQDMQRLMEVQVVEGRQVRVPRCAGPSKPV